MQQSQTERLAGIHAWDRDPLAVTGPVPAEGLVTGVAPQAEGFCQCVQISLYRSGTYVVPPVLQPFSEFRRGDLALAGNDLESLDKSLEVDIHRQMIARARDRIRRTIQLRYVVGSKRQTKENLMQEKPAEQLNFVRSPKTFPTVEVDIDSVPESVDFDDSLYAALKIYASKNSGTRATLYIYESPSVNFHERTYSAFVGVAGPEKLLGVVMSTFQSLPGIRVKYSDSITIDQSWPKFHIENGEVWRPLDIQTWFAGVAERKEDAADLKWDDIVEEAEPGEDPSAESIIPGSVTGKNSVGVRFKRARSDASVGTIKRSMEKIFGLPEGSVQILGPLGKPMRVDAKISTLRKRWDSTQ